MNEPTITELIGVYHADGGIVGEAKYIIGKLLGTAHCALCDITHSPVRRKSAWDAMVARLGVPFRLLHLNEMPADVAGAVGRSGSPVVLQRTSDGLSVLLGPDTLEPLGGSVGAFEQAVRAATGDRVFKAA
ncbi:MAG: hypothetical protein MUE31_02320 [Candidatus Nanopelagicales bacterium]|jgi:hypothetical protein|nr:hypothetical protein [Candidatus Nanopelagicales bacterium]MCU0296351.1 hypothetical protein [Candidatus Nanopelagicales bacterium]